MQPLDGGVTGRGRTQQGASAHQSFASTPPFELSSPLLIMNCAHSSFNVVHLSVSLFVLLHLLPIASSSVPILFLCMVTSFSSHLHIILFLYLHSPLLRRVGGWIPWPDWPVKVWGFVVADGMGKPAEVLQGRSQ